MHAYSFLRDTEGNGKVWLILLILLQMLKLAFKVGGEIYNYTKKNLVRSGS